MKPLALALAAAVLGTGCIWVDDHHDDYVPCSTSLALSWDFLLSDGAVTGCAAADVQWVDVWADGYLADSFYCTDGGGTVLVAPGSVVTVEGIDSAGRIAYRDWVTAGSGCGTQVSSVRPAEGTANLNYSLIGGGCASSPCYLWFSVYDDTAAAPAAVIDLSSSDLVKRSFPYPGDVAIRLAVGTYTLEWMDLVSSSFFREKMTCGPTGFDVGAAALTDVPVALAATCVQ